MWAFQYKHGDRPLEGYTIQRAAGRGGFGEVYYAVSDSGREVALKVVQGYEQIELRGISQCMNLKSPHLVSIFDVRHNHENKPFVIMEFVTGPNLRQLIDESPAGLGTQKSAFFLREISKGLTFLHECGIVHRDLKPANIFYENGYVKIGDYGLSKAITTSQYSGQTVTVGTVHYMAPEIGAGKYDRSIDIYAMGAVLYEMLTGMPPYVGASPSEVLMKHLSSEPDVSNIPQPFARVIQKAMAKDPVQRYQSVQAMVEDVFGAEHVRQSVSVFSPEDLSVVAERIAKKVPAMAGGGGGSDVDRGSSLPGGQADPWARMGSWMDEMGGRVKQMWQAPPASAPAAPVAHIIQDPLPARHRWMLAVMISLMAPLAASLVAPDRLGHPVLTFSFVLTVMWGGALGLLFAYRVILPRLVSDSVFLQRLIFGQMAALYAVLFSLPIWMVGSSSARTVGATLLAILAQFFIFDCKDEMKPEREERVGLGHLFGAGLAAFIASIIFRGHTHLAIASAAGISLLVQILSPWDPVAGARTKAIKEAEAAGDSEKAEQLKAVAERAGAPASGARRPAVPASAAPDRADFVERSPGRYWARPVPVFARIGWIIGVVMLVTMGVLLCVQGGITRSSWETGPFIAAGVSALIFGLLCGIKAFQQTFYGWWGYVAKPVLMTACVASIVSSAIVLGNLPRAGEEEIIIGTLFIVFPAVLMLVLLFIPSRFPRAQAPGMMPSSSTGPSPHVKKWALLLAALCFAGPAGLHRLYVGKLGTGVLWLLTWGLLGIGQLIDVVKILRNEFTDKRGRPLTYWENVPRVAAAATAAPAAARETPERSSGLDWIDRATSECYDAAKNVVVSVTDELKSHVADWREVKQDVTQAVHDGRPKVSVNAPAVVVDLNLRGLLAALAGLLLFAATVASLAVMLDIPGMLHAGIPTPEIRQDLERDVFGTFPEWPTLMRKLGAVAIGIVMLFALVLLVFARQRGGIFHMVRGVVGAVGLIIALLPIGEVIRPGVTWEVIGGLVAQKQHAEAMDYFLNRFQSPPAVFAAVMFLAAIVLLAWPARKDRSAPRVLVAPRPLTEKGT